MKNILESNSLNWLLIVLASLILGWVFRFRMRRIAQKAQTVTKRIVRQHPMETDISPLAETGMASSSELAKIWIKNKDWMYARWSQEDKREKEIRIDPEKRWRYIPIDNRDIRYLSNRGLALTGIINRKGHFYDITGLIEMPTSQQAQQLQFFNVSTKNLNRTTAEREIDWLMESKQNQRKWESRALDPIQQVFFTLMEVPVPPGMLAVHAQEIIQDLLVDGSERDTAKRESWFHFESIYQELSSEFVSSRHNIRSPSAHDVLQAFNELKKEGVTGIEQYVQLDLVVQRIVKNNPNLVIKARKSL